MCLVRDTVEDVQALAYIYWWEYILVRVCLENREISIRTVIRYGELVIRVPT